jgi:HK97 gp10 family phage protein
MSETIKVTGLQELNAALARLDENVKKKYVRGAVGAGARLIRDAAIKNVAAVIGSTQPKSGARRRTGRLQRAIYSAWLAKESTTDTQSFIVSVKRGRNFQSKTTTRRGKTFQTSNKDAYYWTWVEFGHVVTKSKIKGGQRRREAARKPLKAAGQFVPARPFMRPALESNKTAAIEAVRVELAKRIAEGFSK